MTITWQSGGISGPVADLLQHGLRTKPDDDALVSLKTRMTWTQLAEATCRLASQYLALGLKPGDRIASLMPNRPALFIHYLACRQAGLVATPLNYRYMVPEIDHALEVSGASLLLHHGERDRDVADSRRCKLLPKGIVRFGSNGHDGVTYEDLVSPSNPIIDLPTIDADAPVFLYFTSGSTGKPKGVTHTRRTFDAMMASVNRIMAITDADTLLPAASLSHIGGSMFGLATLLAGGRLIISSSSDGSEVLPLLREFHPSLFWMLPSTLSNLVRDQTASQSDFASIRLCWSGGDKVSAALEREFTNLTGFPIHESYGMTEVGLVTISPPECENRLGSVGKLCEDHEMSIRDDNGAEVAVGTPGRLWLRSRGTTIGYWNDPIATKETIVDGWLDTGDVMRIDQDGYLWFCGRKKQIIVHDSSNICPQEVEEAIAEHRSVAEVGVIGIHDLVHGENVRAYVTLKPNSQASGHELIEFARDRIGYKAPEEIVFLHEMPYNATGKVDRRALCQMAENGPHTGERNSPHAL